VLTQLEATPAAGGGNACGTPATYTCQPGDGACPAATTCADENFDCGAAARAAAPQGPDYDTGLCAVNAACTDAECCIPTCGDIYMQVPNDQSFNCAADATSAFDGLIVGKTTDAVGGDRTDGIGLDIACAADPCTAAECCEECPACGGAVVGAGTITGAVATKDCGCKCHMVDGIEYKGATCEEKVFTCEDPLAEGPKATCDVGAGPVLHTGGRQGCLDSFGECFPESNTATNKAGCEAIDATTCGSGNDAAGAPCALNSAQDACAVANGACSYHAGSGVAGGIFTSKAKYNARTTTPYVGCDDVQDMALDTSNVCATSGCQPSECCTIRTGGFGVEQSCQTNADCDGFYMDFYGDAAATAWAPAVCPDGETCQAGETCASPPCGPARTCKVSGRRP
jgi:hypothetical protein